MVLVLALKKFPALCCVQGKYFKDLVSQWSDLGSRLTRGRLLLQQSVSATASYLWRYDRRSESVGMRRMIIT